MDIERLRQKILDLAIRGKLVPQDPNDESATELVEKIRKEKEKLAKEGKIKLSKGDSFIFKGSDNCYYEKIGDETKNITEEIPFEIPDSWTWARMQTIGNWSAGATPSRSNKDYYNGDILWVKTGELNNDYIYDSKEKITNLALKECSLRINKPGDILIAMYGATIGKLGIVGATLTTNQACCACTCNEITYNLYLFYYLLAIKQYLISKGFGGAQPNISKELLHDTLIPLPPIKEQKRIVEALKIILEQIRYISEEKNKLISLIDLTKTKILDYYFGDNSCYKSYYGKDYKLGEILRYIQPGPYIVSSTEYDDSYATPVLTPGKSFILGYTNETDGIFKIRNKVIIFDDFTTASRLVDFDFKVKSSAMKILEVENEDLFDVDYMFYRLQIIKVINDTHKRYWISEYTPISLKIHTLDEQKKIVQAINEAYTILNIMSNSI